MSNNWENNDPEVNSEWVEGCWVFLNTVPVASANTTVGATGILDLYADENLGL